MLVLHLLEHLATMLGLVVGLLAPLTSALGVILCSIISMLSRCNHDDRYLIDRAYHHCSTVSAISMAC